MKQDYWATLLWFLASCVCLVPPLTLDAQNDFITSERERRDIGLLIAGVVFFVLSLRAVPKHEPREFKILVGGCLAVLLLLVLVGTMTFVGMYVGHSRRGTVCLSSIKQLTLAAIMYADDADGRFPIAATWRSATARFSRGTEGMRCPDAKSPWTYAANLAVSGTKVDKIANQADLVYLFEGDSQVRDAVGGPESFVLRHDERGSIAYADGHAKRISKERVPTLVWRP